MKDHHDYLDCIKACLDCAAACNHCAASCTREKDLAMMGRCIQLDMECAVLCYAAAQLMSLGSSKAKEICGLCAAICLACAEECGKHKDEHCLACADACRRCAEHCGRMAA